ncbi:Fur family zinc uptake transcriptional regulator [Methylovirgula ligni]|uniref:Fur family zinc uptake transcriptional regulator n=1 Tax=Methylovirgula ligni TaxID=569860 RepID=A0A3D9YXZ1_9HYPH|nr:Fur family zinc uptake transcriptional regulator [Methylovirgula ligni]
MTAQRVPQPRQKKSQAIAAFRSTMANAEDLCRREGAKLTPARRRVLEILAEEGRPLGAYDMIEKIAVATGKHPAPVSIYRALDFLLENGLVHRLASRNAFLACAHGHKHEEPVVFLICEACGTVTEATSRALHREIALLGAESGFAPHSQVLEITGLCRSCGAQKAAVG